MVGRRGETPLVPPYSFRRPNKAMALLMQIGPLLLAPSADSLRNRARCTAFQEVFS